MNTFKTSLLACCLALSSAAALAQDPMKKDDPAMPKLTMQECKDHMAMDKKDGMPKDEMTKKKDAKCAAMMKKDMKVDDTKKQNGGK